MRLRIYRQCKSALKRVTGYDRHASNSAYNIQKEVHNLLLAGERLTAGRLLPKTDNKAQEGLLETVCATANSREAGQLAGSGDIGKVNSYIAENMQYMTTDFLDRIEQISMMSGLLVLAYTVRVQNEELVLRQRENVPGYIGNRPHFLRKLFWAYIKRGDDEAVRGLLNSSDVQKKPEVLQHLQGLCSALGLIPKDAGGAEIKPGHTEFAGYVKDKRIAVLGPSTSGTDHAGEIKSGFDIIIRTSYRGPEYLPGEQRDLLPHISYYGDIDWDSFLAAGGGGNRKHLSGLRFAVLSRGEQEQRLKDLGLTNIRVATHMRRDFLFLGKHNMIQTILHDLSGYQPARIKVFYANLFLSDTLYDEEYAKPGTGVKTQGSREENLMFRRIMVKHNIISQYDYTRQLYKRGLIEADTRLAEILDMGTEEFISRLEEQENSKGIILRS